MAGAACSYPATCAPPHPPPPRAQRVHRARARAGDRRPVALRRRISPRLGLFLRAHRQREGRRRPFHPRCAPAPASRAAPAEPREDVVASPPAQASRTRSTSASRSSSSPRTAGWASSAPAAPRTAPRRTWPTGGTLSSCDSTGSTSGCTSTWTTSASSGTSTSAARPPASSARARSATATAAPRGSTRSSSSRRMRS